MEMFSVLPEDREMSRIVDELNFFSWRDELRETATDLGFAQAFRTPMPGTREDAAAQVLLY
jgi:hypothetical protein